MRYPVPLLASSPCPDILPRSVARPPAERRAYLASLRVPQVIEDSQRMLPRVTRRPWVAKGLVALGKPGQRTRLVEPIVELAVQVHGLAVAADRPVELVAEPVSAAETVPGVRLTVP